MRLLPTLITAALLALPIAARAETPPSDPRAVAIADQVMHSLGGRERWDAQRGLRWSFGFEQNDTIRSLRRHSWDKHTGWHRVEGKNRAGLRFVFIANLNDTTGKAWMNGNPIEGDSLRKLLTMARRMWTNDAYWMLMPYKLRDPGVILGYEGEVKDSTGAVSDKLALSFDHVGLTPGDRYWIYVNRANHRIDRWEHVLEGQQPPAEGETWEGWQERDGLWFPTVHRRGNGNQFTRDVETVSQFEPTEFTGP